MSSTWGEHIRISIFGGSHTEAIGVNMDGLPAGEAIDWEQVLAQMARRAPPQRTRPAPGALRAFERRYHRRAPLRHHCESKPAL